MTKENRPRLLLIDTFKLLALIAIFTLHSNEFIFFEDDFPLGEAAPFYHYIKIFLARPMSLGGQIIVGIVYFLYGLRGIGRKKFFKVAFLALFGQFIFSLVFGLVEWDIYFYVSFVSFVFAFTNEKIWNRWGVIILSFFILWIPTELITNNAPQGHLWDVLTGRYTMKNCASWPLLPWFFLSSLTYGLGLKARDNWDKLTELKKWEFIFWPSAFLISLPVLGHYFWVPIGPHFYDFVFKQSPWIFWGNYIFIVFFIRLAFVKQVQEATQKSRFFNFISNLCWVQHVGIIYFVSVFYVALGTLFYETFLVKPHIFDLFYMSGYPVCEFTVRGLKKLFTMVRKPR